MKKNIQLLVLLLVAVIVVVGLYFAVKSKEGMVLSDTNNEDVNNNDENNQDSTLSSSDPLADFTSYSSNPPLFPENTPTPIIGPPLITISGSANVQSILGNLQNDVDSVHNKPHFYACLVQTMISPYVQFSFLEGPDSIPLGFNGKLVYNQTDEQTGVSTTETHFFCQNPEQFWPNLVELTFSTFPEFIGVNIQPFDSENVNFCRCGKNSCTSD
jgi:hypothetical protein